MTNRRSGTTQLYYFRRDDSPQTALLTVRLTARALRPGVRRAARSADLARPGRRGDLRSGPGRAQRRHDS